MTGSSDGLVRLVQIHPNKLLGAVADHGDFPVERIKMDHRSKWMGSVSHDSILKMTDLEGALEDSDKDESAGDNSESDTAAEKDQGIVRVDEDRPMLRPTRHEDEEAEDDSDVPTEPRSKKRKRKAQQKAKKKDGEGVEPGFFSGL